MKAHGGLYVALFPDGKIRKEVIDNSGETVAFETSVTEELLYYANMLYRLCDEIMKNTSGIVAVFSGEDEMGYKYAVGQMGGDLRAFVKEMNAALAGRGGGKPFFAQGSVSAKREEIERYFA